MRALSAGAWPDVLLRPVSRDVLDEMPQGAECLLVLFAIGPQLHAVLLGDDERDLQDVYRIETEALAVQRSIRVDIRRCDLQVQRLDDQIRDLAFERSAVGRRRRLSQGRRFAAHTVATSVGIL